jgi:hypothetical protein
MKLNLNLLEKVHFQGGKIHARCPACAESGADKKGHHLIIYENDRFGCAVASGHAGAAHRRRIWQLAGNGASYRHSQGPVPATRRPAKEPPRFPALRPLRIEEMTQVMQLRHWPSYAGLQILTASELLWHGMVWDGGEEHSAWIITDYTRRNAQARRLDGQPWAGIGGAKAKTLPHGDPTWPIGILEAGACEVVLLCEGQPDFTAAPLVAFWEGVRAAPVCMTGAGQAIKTEALRLFVGRHVRIAVHDDATGRAAGQRWTGQLHDAGVVAVDYFDFSGLQKRDLSPVKDLADYATLLDPEVEAGPYILDRLGAGPETAC